MPLFCRLYNFAHWLTQNPEEAEDLVQEPYAKTLRGLSSFQHGTDCRACIYRILSNTFSLSAPGRIRIVTIQKDGTIGTVGSAVVFPPALGLNHRRIGEW
jgi:hypothetical protein